MWVDGADVPERGGEVGVSSVEVDGCIGLLVLARYREIIGGMCVPLDLEVEGCCLEW